MALSELDLPPGDDVIGDVIRDSDRLVLSASREDLMDLAVF